MRPVKSKSAPDFADDILNKTDAVASVNECTGLMPTPPENMDEEESYNEIYIVPAVKGLK